MAEKSLLDKAISHYNNKNYEATLDLLSQLTSMNSKNSEYQNYKGSVLLKLKKYKEALTCFETALGINPNNFDYYFGKINCLIELQKYEEAEIYIGIAVDIKQSPDDSYLCYWRGRCYFSKRLLNRALFEYNKSISLCCDVAPVYYWRALCLREMKKYEQSCENFEIALSHGIETDSVFYYEKGLSLMKNEMFNTSLVEFDKAISLEPKNALFYLSKGNVYSMQNQTDKALLEYLQSANLDENNAEVYFGISKAYFKAKKLDDALKNINKALEYDSKPDFYETKGLILYDLKRFEDSNKMFMTAIGNGNYTINDQTKEKMESIVSKYQDKVNKLNEVLAGDIFTQKTLKMFSVVKKPEKEEILIPEPQVIVRNLKINKALVLETGDKKFSFICRICDYLVRSPTQCLNCKVYFCDSCITESKQRNDGCPSCFKVRFKTKVCISVLGLDSIDIACPALCGDKIKYRDLESHLKKCELNKNVNCSLCLEEFDKKSFSKHILTCPSKKSPCPFCKLGIKRPEIPSHIIQCPMKQVECYTCEFDFPLKFFNEHKGYFCDIFKEFKKGVSESKNILGQK